MSYYLKNLLLNMGTAAIVALFYVPIKIVSMMSSESKESNKSIEFLGIVTAGILWLAILLNREHKVMR